MLSRYFLLAIPALILLAGHAEAATKRQSTEEITENADKIVLGAVISKTSYWTPDSRIATDVVIAPEVTIKGDESTTLVVQIPGGIVGDTRMSVSDAPEFKDNERVLLFLKRSGDKFEIAGRDSGKHPVSSPEAASAIETAFDVVEKKTGQKLQYKRDRAKAFRDAATTTTTSTLSTPSCYAADEIKWSGNLATYKLNATIPTAWAPSINAAAATWNNAGSVFRFSGNISSPNELSYVDLVAKYGSTYSNTYALATVWSNIYTNQIVQATIEISTRFQWSTTAQPYMADIQNILTHEFGHWLHLADIYDPSTCAEVTMWGTAPLGETKKRTLEQSDIDGLIAIYGKSTSSIAPPVLTSPANGTTSVTRTPTLTWNAVTGATSYQVYFGTTASPSLVATISGTTYAPGTLAAGTRYYWRVVASNGTSSATSGTWSFTTAGLSRPVLVSPKSGATITTLTPTLQWNAVTGATSYDVYLGTTTTLVLIGTTTATTFKPTGLQAGKLYYWKVVARNSSGTASSILWYFRT
jgi:hypothetical protein